MNRHVKRIPPPSLMVYGCLWIAHCPVIWKFTKMQFMEEVTIHEIRVSACLVEITQESEIVATPASLKFYHLRSIIQMMSEIKDVDHKNTDG